MNEPRSQLHAIVEGQVQGVSFRYYTRRRAFQLGITGWVQNNPDGSVEVVAQGTAPQLQKLVDFLRVGPPMAVVSSVTVSYEPIDIEMRQFEIHYPSFTTAS